MSVGWLWVNRYKSFNSRYLGTVSWPRSLGESLGVKRLLSRCAFIVVIVLVGLLAAAPVAAQRPPAPQLLPHHTLAVARIPDMPLVVERFQETALGRLRQAPRMKPLVAQLFRSAQDAFKQIEDRVGLPLDQLLKIPQGEVCVAFVASPDFEQEPGVVVIIDTKDQVAQARKLLSAAEEIAKRNGGGRSTDRIGDEEVNGLTGIGDARRLATARRRTAH